MKKWTSYIIIVLAFVLFFTNCASSESATAQLQEMYAQGELLMTQGDYSGAATKFESLGVYSDSSQMAMYCKAFMAAENLEMYDVAISAFQKLGDFKDSKQLVQYYQGRLCQANGDQLAESNNRNELVKAKEDYEAATQVFSELVLFKDCLARLDTCQKGIENVVDKIHAYDYAEADKLERAGRYEEALKAFKGLGLYRDSMKRAIGIQEKINAQDYKAADALEKAGKYEEAVQAFKALGRYSDSAQRAIGAQEKIYAREYEAADALEKAGKYEEAVQAFKALGRYSDSAQRATGAQDKIYAREYEAACRLEQAGSYNEAIEAFESLKQYRDSEQRAASILKEHKFEIVGNIVTLGSYEQDNNKTNGYEPLEWIVLEVQDKKSFLVSRYGLEQHPHYHAKLHGLTWEKSEIRTWLNQTFINLAFNEEEKKKILTTNVNNKNQGSEKSRDGGKTTTDKIFLLSYQEACKYFVNETDRICKATAYAAQKGVYIEDGNCCWWLRSPAYFKEDMQSIITDGSLGGSIVTHDRFAVRPAMWIDVTPNS